MQFNRIFTAPALNWLIPQLRARQKNRAGRGMGQMKVGKSNAMFAANKKHAGLLGQEGFTLLDLSMWLIVIGLLVAGGLYQYHLYAARKSFDKTTSTLQKINSAMTNFYYENGAYPCPAPLNAARTAANYGVAGACAGPAAFITGGVPFKNLLMPEEMALDAWHNRLTYTVTRTMTDRDTFDDAPGALIIDQVPGIETPSGIIASTLPPVPRPNLHYIVVSHGENGFGARTRDAVVAGACPNQGTFPREADNCDGDNNFFDSYLGRSIRDNGAARMDDVVMWSDNLPERIWAESSADRQNVFSRGLTVGIGTDNPDNRYALDVTGNIYADGGNIRAADYCDPTTDPDGPGGIAMTCFNVDMIAGSGVDCADQGSPGLRGFANGQAVCTEITGISGNCAVGEYVTGINPSGEVICSP